ncbi:thermonuclease family protein [Gammaproteobacteria bacterium]|nr:thermonuclease family protein [Gammaproteobacteria bacterium]
MGINASAKSANSTRRFTITIRFICFFIATFPILGWAEESLNGQVLKVVDGDTITIITDAQQTQKIRLSEIDTPERDQPWGRQASRALSKKVANKLIVAKVSGVDRYDRIIAEIFVGERNINHEMVSEGHAWAYRRYLKNDYFLELERIAKENGLGLWGLTEGPIPPWQWRRGSR